MILNIGTSNFKIEKNEVYCLKHEDLLLIYLGFGWLGFGGDNNINADNPMNFLTYLIQDIYAQK